MQYPNTTIDSIGFVYQDSTPAAPPPTTGEKLMAKMLPLQAAFSGPGTWQFERLEQVRHFRHWIAACCRFITTMCRQDQPNVAYAVDTEEREKHASEKKLATKGKREWPKTRRFVEKKVVRKSNPSRPNEDLEYADPNHALISVLRRPNPTQDWGQFFEEFLLYYCLTGASYIWVVPDEDGFPSELWVIPSFWVKPISLKEERLVDYFQVSPWGVGPAEIVNFKPEEIIEFKDPNLINKLGASSRLQQNAEVIDQYESVQLCRYYASKNGAFIGTIIELPPDADVPDDQTMTRFGQKFMARFQGEQHFNQPMILPPGAKANRNDASIELAYIESSNQLRDFIISQVFSLSKTALGIMEDVNRAAFIASIAQAVYHVINPLLARVGNILTEELAMRWDERLRIFWPDQTPADPDSVRADYAMAAANGAVAANEIRVNILDLEPLDDPIYDEPLIPAGMVPAQLDDGTGADFSKLIRQYTDQGPEANDKDNALTPTADKGFSRNGNLNGVH